MKRVPNSSSAAGFSLIEVLVATMILSGAVLVLANAWGGNFNRVRNARVNNTMAMLLERKMTEYEVLAKEKPISEIPEEEGDSFGAKFPGYRWTMKSQPFEMPNLSGALTAREGGADEMTLMIVNTMTTYIKEAVKEVNVSVYYKSRSGREIQHSATSYFVDYAKEIPLPGMPGGAGGGAGGGP